MGRIGAHRLAPGESSSFRIDYEGYLKIGDGQYAAGYDPDQFSVPKFDTPPIAATVDVWSSVCDPTLYRSLEISDFNVSTVETGQVLDLTVSNKGAEIVSTIQLKLAYRKDGETIEWVEPHYFQNNLIPGESRQERIQLNSLSYVTAINDVDIAKVNGTDRNMAPDSRPITIPLDGTENISLSIDYDAMIFEPLR